jgi:hypothetical protein
VEFADKIPNKKSLTPHDVCYFASMGNVEKLREILKADPSKVNWKDEEGRAGTNPFKTLFFDSLLCFQLFITPPIEVFFPFFFSIFSFLFFFFQQETRKW